MSIVTISLRMSAILPTGNPSVLTLSFILWFALECQASTSSKLGNSLSTSSLAIIEEGPCDSAVVAVDADDREPAVDSWDEEPCENRRKNLKPPDIKNINLSTAFHLRTTAVWDRDLIIMLTCDVSCAVDPEIDPEAADDEDDACSSRGR